MLHRAVVADLDRVGFGLGEPEGIGQGGPLVRGKIGHLLERPGKALVDPALHLIGAVPGLAPVLEVLGERRAELFGSEGEEVGSVVGRHGTAERGSRSLEPAWAQVLS